MSERALSGGLSNERFVARRRLRRRRAFLALGILLLIVLGALVWGLHQRAVRVSRVEVYGTDESLSTIARAQMRGSYLGIIPRDSIFFFPASRIRMDILAVYLDIAAVSISRKGFTGLLIKIDYRVPVARWCGSTRDASGSDLAASSSRPNLNENCYLFDASGLIYATTSTAVPLNSFVLYQSLADENHPIGSTLPSPESLPATFGFARQLRTFGSPVSIVAIHDGEVDEYLASGTRITYVLGDEQNAFTALVSARANLNLADGSLEYVDVRFGGKIYLKKK